MKILLSAVEHQENYAHAIQACGATPILQYPLPDDVDYDGLLLCGGKTDIHPRHFSAQLIEGINVDEMRDQIEFTYLKKFLQTGKPIMGICRGLQVLNVALGGTLIQDLPNAHEHRLPNDVDAVHEVTAQNDSIFQTLYGERFFVNSCHHQAVDTLGQGLRVTLRSSHDGVVEAVEHVQKPYWGVQFHPERMCLRLERADTVNGLPLLQHFIRMCQLHKTQNHT